LKVRLTNLQHRVDFYPKKILDISKKTLDLEGYKKVSINIIVVNSNYIRKLNSEFRKRNTPTDVLAFELKSPFGENGSENFLGDVYICADIARERVDSLFKKHPGILLKGFNLKRLVTNELCLYAVHGILHLIGYEDRTKRLYNRMCKRQEDILKEYGI